MVSEAVREFTEQAQEAARKQARVMEVGGLARFEAEEREKEERDEMEGEGAALEVTEMVAVAASWGETLEIREPLGLAWARALARVLAALRPLAAVWAAARTPEFERLTNEEKGRYALDLILRYAGESIEETDRTIETLFAAADALLCKPDGWLAGRARLEDLAQITLALLKVSKPERFSYFFGQIRAAAMGDGPRPGR
jgi:hypothetical protein